MTHCEQKHFESGFINFCFTKKVFLLKPVSMFPRVGNPYVLAIHKNLFKILGVNAKKIGDIKNYAMFVLINIDNLIPF